MDFGRIRASESRSSITISLNLEWAESGDGCPSSRATQGTTEATAANTTATRLMTPPRHEGSATADGGAATIVPPALLLNDAPCSDHGGSSPALPSVAGTCRTSTPPQPTTTSKRATPHHGGSKHSSKRSKTTTQDSSQGSPFLSFVGDELFPGSPTGSLSSLCGVPGTVAAGMAFSLAPAALDDEEAAEEAAEEPSDEEEEDDEEQQQVANDDEPIAAQPVVMGSPVPVLVPTTHQHQNTPSPAGAAGKKVPKAPVLPERPVTKAALKATRRLKFSPSSKIKSPFKKESTRIKVPRRQWKQPVLEEFFLPTRSHRGVGAWPHAKAP